MQLLRQAVPSHGVTVRPERAPLSGQLWLGEGRPHLGPKTSTHGGARESHLMESCRRPAESRRPH